MINNRLFKKINAIFWGLLTWMPIVIFVLCLFKTDGIQFNSEFYPGQYILKWVEGFSNVISYEIDGTFINPLSSLFYDLYLTAFGEIESVFMGALLEICSWACWVQVMRLLVYVFMWFIDLISGLFDLMSFNRKGDN